LSEGLAPLDPIIEYRDLTTGSAPTSVPARDVAQAEEFKQIFRRMRSYAPGSTPSHPQVLLPWPRGDRSPMPQSQFEAESVWLESVDLGSTESIALSFAEEALSAIARKAIERKTGPRGLRSIMEGILLDTMFELPSLEGVAEVVITKQVVEGTAPPLHIYPDRSTRRGKAIA
jgi:hypothetical protein